MHFASSSQTKNDSIILFLIIAWFIYLSTLSPTVFYRDTPEFVNTAFTLGISHPAGFPIYNLMAKAVTFFPMGSVPFKVNLFSSLMGCLALGVLYLASITFLRVLFGPEHSDSFKWPALLPVGFLATCIPFWGNTMLAEVYTLHTLFTILIILCLLKWKEKEDFRYLYSGALVYGLSAGNHGTVAFYLPAILILFFFWCRKECWRHLSVCVSFFILGFSIYLYLPIRSLTEPTFDWGNPETLEGFLFQVTDRKDSQTHFSAINSTTASLASGAQNSATALNWIAGLFSGFWRAGIGFLTDIFRNLSIISVVGFLVGAILCVRKNIPFFLFCAVIVGTNAAFFISWKGEAFLPSYVVVALLTALSLYWVIYTPWRRRPTGEPLDGAMPGSLMATSKLVGKTLLIAIGLSIPWAILKNYPRVDHSWNYLSESVTRKVYLTLPDRALFITGMSWFFYNYNQDVRRLRDDVTAVSVWDLISPHRSGLMTPKRYPHLFLPDMENSDFKTFDNISDYTQEFIEQNAVVTPVILEQIATLYEQTKLTPIWKPYRNVLLLYKSGDLPENTSQYSSANSWQEFTNLMDAELVKPGSGRDRDWINVPGQWIVSMRDYFHATEEYALERDALELMKNFMGQHGAQWHFLYLDNLILDRRLGKAELLLNKIGEKFPNSFEYLLGQGLAFNAQGNRKKAIESFSQAVTVQPDSFRVYLEMAATFRELNDPLSAKSSLVSAQKRLKNMRQAIQLNAEKKRIESAFR